MMVQKQKITTFSLFDLFFTLNLIFFASQCIELGFAANSSFSGIKFPQLQAYYGINPHLCRIEQNGSSLLKELYNKNEKMFDFLRKSHFNSFWSFAFAQSLKTSFDLSQKAEFQFFKKLKDLNEKFKKFISDKEKDDALGVFYLELLKERFKLSIEIMEGVKKSNDVLIQGIRKRDYDIFNKINEAIYPLNTLNIGKESAYLKNLINHQDKKKLGVYLEEQLKISQKILQGTQLAYQSISHCIQQDIDNRKRKSQLPAYMSFQNNKQAKKNMSKMSLQNSLKDLF